MLKLTLGTTALLGAVAASAATLFPELPLRILYFTKPEFWQCAPLVPWFAWCMLLFTLANALVTNLLARGRFAIAGVLILLAAAYGVTLWLLRDRLLAMEMFAAYKLRCRPSRASTSCCCSWRCGLPGALEKIPVRRWLPKPRDEWGRGRGRVRGLRAQGSMI